jgi:N-acyl-D-aspartate/D-glutamate deacylase
MKTTYALGITAILLAGASLLSLTWATAQTAPADYLIAGGKVYTGEDKPAIKADVVIAGDKIVYVGPDGAKKYQAKRTFDATGKIVSPGFIDGHSHPERWLNSPDAKTRTLLPWITQGETLLFVGVEGAGTANQKEQADKFAASGIGPNLLPLVGYGVLRSPNGILHSESRAATPAEMTAAKAQIRKGMCEGAWGLSVSLFNAPQNFATTEEVIELAREAARYGGLFHTHQRDEASYNIGLMGSTLESIRVGREAHIPVQITHIKGLGPDVWGMAPRIVSVIDKARAEGVNVWADQYPWAAASAGLEGMVFPIWAEEGGRAAVLKRLEDPVALEKIRKEGAENIRRRGGPESLLMVALDQEWTGKTIGQMAKIWNVTPVDAVIRIVKTSATGGGVASFAIDEGDIKVFMKQPWMTTSSDAGANHPRLYSSYPRKYEKYVIQEHVISEQQFIRSATGLEADYLHLDRRGYLRPGYYADVVVFDPARFKQKNDFVHFDIPSPGVDQLFVNGTLTVLDSQPTGALAGRTVAHVPLPGRCGP